MKVHVYSLVETEHLVGTPRKEDMECAQGQDIRFVKYPEGKAEINREVDVDRVYSFSTLSQVHASTSIQPLKSRDIKA